MSLSTRKDFDNMFNIKRARNDFNGFRATVPQVEFDGFMYVLESAAGLYAEAGSEKLEGCQKLIRVWTELAYFDKEKHEVHLQMGFRELEVFTQALYDVMLVGFQPTPDHSFSHLLLNPDVKTWIKRSE